jgi:hypothetical protein
MAHITGPHVQRDQKLEGGKAVFSLNGHCP